MDTLPPPGTPPTPSPVTTPGTGPSASADALAADAADAVRLKRLRRMRALALSLLVVAAIVYLLTLHRSGPWSAFLGYVNAGAEASMVGAIADWFAVTALFRHPLGLPIPHTALVPRRKDEFGKSLEDFFTENFLREDIIRERLVAAGLPRRIGTWLSGPENARRAVAEAATVAAIGLRRLRDDDVRALVNEAVLPRFREEPIAPIAGALLAEVLADGAHRGFVDLVIEEGHRWLVQHRDTFTEVLGERAPWWAPDRLNEMVTERLHVEAVRWLEDIGRDPDHHARHALDSMLEQLAQDLLHDADTQARAEVLKERLLDQAQLVETGLSLWAAFRRALLEALEDPVGPVRARAEIELVALGRQLVEDQALAGRLEVRVADVVVWATDRYGDELAAIITHTIKRWDGREAARKIELHVGPDLQFIRINGTIVGGLVGVIIHAVTVAIG